MYTIYWLINETKTKTYVGFTDNLDERVKYHRSGRVKSTASFGGFTYYVLETVNNLEEAIKRERYWKSCAGRKKLKILFNKIIN
jgi:putative endonuclease